MPALSRSQDSEQPLPVVSEEQARDMSRRAAELRQAEAREAAIRGARNQAWKQAAVPLRHADIAVDPCGSEPLWVAALERLNNRLGSGFMAALVGERGTGKTQLATNLVYHGIKRAEVYGWADLQFSALYTRVMRIFLDMRGCFRRESSYSESDMVDAFIRPHLLIIDEAQERGETDWENRVLTYIIDERYAAKRDTLLIANLRPEHLAASLGPSIMSRMQETGGIIECNWPSFRSKK